MTNNELQIIAENPQSFLNQAFKIRASIASKRARIGSLWGIAESITPTYSQVPGGGGGSAEKIPNCVASIIEAQNELENEIRQLIKSADDISKAINELVEDPLNKNLLEMRYCAMLPWEDVAKKLGKTRRWMMTLHERALKEMIANCALAISKSI